jgi:hypothetical protein
MSDKSGVLDRQKRIRKGVEDVATLAVQPETYASWTDVGRILKGEPVKRHDPKEGVLSSALQRVADLASSAFTVAASFSWRDVTKPGTAPLDGRESTVQPPRDNFPRP